jgi:hypothetical protein
MDLAAFGFKAPSYFTAAHEEVRLAGSGLPYRRVQGRTAQPICVHFPRRLGQRVPRIDIAKAFDAVLLVLLDENFDATAIYEAERSAVIETLTAPGSRVRNERGAMAISKFKAIGRKVWPDG